MLKIVVIWGLIYLITVTSSFSAAMPYEYPEKDPWKATASAAILKGAKRFENRWSSRTHRLIKDRNQLQDWYFSRSLRYSLLTRAESSPLVVMIPGMGAPDDSAMSRYLGEFLYRAGFAVLVLPSPYHARFAVSASRTGLVGDSARDSEDLYDALARILNKLRKDGELRPSVIHLIGYSLGGLHAAYLRKIDGERKILGLDRVVLLNPPLHFQSGLRRFENLAQLKINGLGPKIGLYFEATHCLVNHSDNYSIDTHDDYFIGFYRRDCIERWQAQYVVGRYMTGFISDTANAALNVYNIYQPEGRKVDPLAYGVDSLSDYLTKIYFPLQGINETVDEFASRNSLAVLAEEMHADRRMFLIHNRDDIILSPYDFKSFQNIFGARATFFPSGGHLGNLWTKAYRFQILKALDARERMPPTECNYCYDHDGRQ